MNGFQRILKFHILENYNNARKIADENIESLVNNTSLKEEEKEYLPTYISTVRERFLYASGDLVNNTIENKDEEIKDYVIKIYEVSGNRKSKLSITQNEQLRKIVFK